MAGFEADRRVLPRRLGVGVYISDSEDSCGSEIRKWLEGSEEEASVGDVGEASTVYESANEASISSDGSESSSDSEFVLDDEWETQLSESVMYPDPLKGCRGLGGSLEGRQVLKEKVLKQSLGFDAKITALQAKRARRCAQIEQDHLSRSVMIALIYQADNGATTAKKDHQGHQPAKQPESGQTSMHGAGVSEVAGTSPSVTPLFPQAQQHKGAPRPVELSTDAPDVPNTTSPETDPIPAVNQGQTNDQQSSQGTGTVPRDGLPQEAPVPVQAGEPGTEEHAVFPTTTQAVHSHPPEMDPSPGEAANAQSFKSEPMTGASTSARVVPEPSRCPYEQSQTVSKAAETPPAVVLSEELLQRSEQMRIPHAFPPPPALFSFTQLQPEDERTEQEVALHASRTAIEFEAYHKGIAQEMIQKMGDYATNIGNRSVCRGIDKNMKLDVMQIAATETQVHAKVSSILQTIAQVEGTPGVVYAYAQLSRHLISKCAGISDPLVFAVAKTAVKIMEHHPSLLSMLLSFLHEVSVLTVPKYYSSEDVHDTLLEKLGFRDIAGTQLPRKESHDEFIARQSGYVKFYAAIIELDSSVHGLEFGWSYLSRMLNNLPPSRITASALMSFLNVAGNSLFKKYKRQFFKVLLYIHTRFLVGLANSDDIEAKAVFSRLQTYLKTNQFGKPPPSKTMPRTAASLRVVT